MANSKISALTSATTPVAGTEVLPIVQSGATVKVAVSDLTAGRAISAAGITDTGNLTFSGTGLRILGDFSNATTANRTAFQDATSNSNTIVPFIPNGTATITGVVFSNAADIANASLTVLSAQSTQCVLAATRSGTGSFLPLRFQTSGSTKIDLDTAGIVTMSAYGAGAATFSATGVISSVSDETWKIKDGVPNDPIGMVKRLAPGYWFYNDSKKTTFGAERQLGFYAQNVNSAIGPEAAPEPQEITNTDENGVVTGTGEFRPWGYYDRSVLAVTVLALQKALATIESLTARIETLETKIPA